MGEGFQTNDFEVKYTLLMIGSSVTAKLGQNRSFSVWWLVCQPTQQTFTHTFTWGRAIFKLSQILSWFSLLDLEDVPCIGGFSLCFSQLPHGFKMLLNGFVHIFHFNPTARKLAVRRPTWPMVSCLMRWRLQSEFGEPSVGSRDGELDESVNRSEPIHLWLICWLCWLSIL